MEKFGLIRNSTGFENNDNNNDLSSSDPFVWYSGVSCGHFWQHGQGIRKQDPVHQEDSKPWPRKARSGKEPPPIG